MSVRVRIPNSAAGFIAPCLPSRAEKPPSSPNWIHEIKHDGFRMMVRRDGAGIRLFTRNGYDWSDRYPLIRHAAHTLRAQSFVLDGEAVNCNEDGFPDFQTLRYQLDGRDLRREPIEMRKATLVKLLRKSD